MSNLPLGGGGKVGLVRICPDPIYLMDQQGLHKEAKEPSCAETLEAGSRRPARMIQVIGDEYI